MKSNCVYCLERRKWSLLCVFPRGATRIFAMKSDYMYCLKGRRKEYSLWSPTICINSRGDKDLCYEVRMFVLLREAAMIFAMKFRYVYFLEGRQGSLLWCLTMRIASRGKKDLRYESTYVYCLEWWQVSSLWRIIMCIYSRGGKDLCCEVQLCVLPREVTRIFIMKSRYVYCLEGR